MSEDLSTRRGVHAGRLWTDPRDGDETQPWLRPPPRMRPRDLGGPPPPPAPPDNSARRRAILIVLLVVALIGIGLVVGLLLSGGSDTPRTAPAVLSVVPGAAPADQHSRSVRAIYATASPSVVFVSVTQNGQGDSGTGFIVDGNGTIVTNAHVVAGATTAQVRLTDGGSDVTAKVIGVDVSSDLAVLRVNSRDTAGLHPLALANSDKVQVGDLAVAIGYPLGLDRTATSGIVSGLGRQIRAPNGFSIDKVIQTDAPINPGNSGGPLLDAAGRVIGVNSQIATAGAGGGSVGIGFAVPSNTVRQVVPRIIGGQTIKRAFLGVATSDTTVAQGAVVETVVPSGPGDAAGLAPDDIITAAGSTPVRRSADVNAAVQKHHPGDTVDFHVTRGGVDLIVPVTLGTRPG